MRITKSNRVLIEITNRCHGCLESGGICVRVQSYPLAGVMEATGLNMAQIADADPTDNAPAYGEGVTIAEACNHEMEPRIIRTGRVIQ